jgi:hypothetical protein
MSENQQNKTNDNKEQFLEELDTSEMELVEEVAGGRAPAENDNSGCTNSMCDF